MGRSEPIRRGRHGVGASASEIPDKLYFRIGEVARLCEVPAYVLRFWESEFPQLKPNKGGTGQRLYRRRDVELALRVKTLLKDEGYTIPGARQMLKMELKQKEPQLALIGGAAPDTKNLRALRRELEALAAMLAKPIQSADAEKRAVRAPAPIVIEEKTVQSIRPSRRVSAPTPVPAEIVPADPAPTPAPLSRVPKPAPAAGLLFDLFDSPQNSEGDER
jgi:DNA-binding transcriptional MerR regulator